jgi:hypothetical protein
VSSILDALRQLENAGSQPAPDDMPPMESESRTRWPLLALAGACVVGIVMTWALWPSPAPIGEPPAPDATLASNAVALPPAAPAPPPARVRDAEPPRAEMEAKPAAPMAEPAPPRMAAARPPVARNPIARAAAPVPEPDEAAEYEPAPEESPTAGIGRNIPRPPGEPLVRVGSITYSSSPTRRVVSLSVNNSQPIYVREGERVGGVEVTLIMPDGVYVKHNGNIFAVSR